MSAVSTKLLKYLNIAVATVAILCSLSQLLDLYGNMTAFFQAIYGIGLSLPIVYLEFKPIPGLYKFASFYFSFLGRGLLYLLLGLFISFGSLAKIICSIFLSLVGAMYIMFQYMPDVKEPGNFKNDGLALAVGQNGIEDSDEVI